MRYLVIAVVALWAILIWQPVLTDIALSPEPASIYKCWQRKLGTADPWVKFGEVLHPTVQITLPTPSAKMEYAVSALDLAGNDSSLSLPTTARPETPAGVKVER